MIKGVAFDMDGTLTRPVIDFNEIRRAVGVTGRDRPVFEQIMDMTEPEKSRALRILEEMEMDAARKSEPNPGLERLVDYLDKKSLQKGIYTRNMGRALELTLERIGLSGRFSPLVTRDHKLKLKPDPEMINHILQSWRLDPGQVLVVGDFLFDIMAGRAAGCRTVFLNNRPEKTGPELADFEVDRLDLMIEIIEELNDA